MVWKSRVIKERLLSIIMFITSEVKRSYSYHSHMDESSPNAEWIRLSGHGLQTAQPGSDHTQHLWKTHPPSEFRIKIFILFCCSSVFNGRSVRGKASCSKTAVNCSVPLLHGLMAGVNPSSLCITDVNTHSSQFSFASHKATCKGQSFNSCGMRTYINIFCDCTCFYHNI